MLDLSPDTRIADLAAQDPKAGERLAGLHPALPTLGAQRLVTLGDVARMAELPVEAVLAVARGEAAPDPRGFLRPTTQPASDDWFGAAEADPQTVRIDVRPILAGGEDPFSRIMGAVPRVPAGGYLLLDAPFDPAPLRRVLAGKGFVSQGRKLDAAHWRLCFRRDEPRPEAPRERAPGRQWQEADGTHVDVRGLEPPQPMTRILELIDGGALTHLVVHHEREPVFLYAELAERGWACVAMKEVGGEVRLELARQG